MNPLVASLTYRSWPWNHCQARLIGQHGDQDVHMAQICTKLEKGQKTLDVKPTRDLLSNHSVWTRIHAGWWLAKEDVAITKFGSKIDGDLVLSGHDPADSYKDDRVAWECVVIVASHFRQALKDRVEKSPYFGIMVDETTDTSVNQQMIVFIKFLDKNQFTGNWETVVEYLDLTSPENSTARGITVHPL
jgi:hypothetical protein